MSLSAGLPGQITTDGGLAYTRLRGPVMAGQVADGGAAVGPLPAAGGFICVQSTASLVNQVVTSSNTTIGSRASFMYIPVALSTWLGLAAPPYVGVGTPIVWEDGSGRLMVWSSGRSSWMVQTITSSALLGDGKGFTTSA